jgi:TolB protein
MFRSALAALLFLVAGAATAQGLSINIVEGNASAIPIAIVPFGLESAGLPPETDVAAVIAADFNRSGQFRSLPKQDVVEFPTRGSEIKYGTWNVLKQDYLVVGRMLDAEGGGYRIEFELHDVAKQQSLLRLAVNARASDLRGAAHQIADLIYEKITGIRGAFWTRIAYVTSTGTGNARQYALMVADSDGYGPQVVVRSREPLMSPAWSPDGRRLAYVSFERGNSSIFIQEITTGQRQIVASYKGINGAPAFSPDGSRLALTLSMSGNPEIYVMDLASRRTTQLTRHFSIDTEPQWMPDGSAIVFTSDRAGKPQIYQVPATGGEATRLTFQGEYNARASVAYDGKRLAMAQGSGNVYRIAVLDRTRGGAGELNVLSPGNLDESPSFAPNASMVLYAAREGSRGVLYAVSADGRVRQRLVLADGDVREPAWSPFRQR